MSLLAEAIAQQRPAGPDCGVVTALHAHPDDAADILELIEASRDRRVTYANAASVFKAHAIAISADTLSRHVRGQCRCPKP